ncbi:IclR family transcriptional regulator [Granulosicoccus antarcticus]|uniref:HTH-type transcriptional repressor AllR n=1 Tax=Granulosicoccus antarcticus IMCC3135 TaxID=1192854 RepID=A0A2Z2P226_9GAMM|nr:IclR family transcriptional regulator [Granulosicoccus antarcticus]ASJ73694.1 putative HTH-type transcriptional regulator RhmR [Granulosicoccus antarcticus IMCC3135]
MQPSIKSKAPAVDSTVMILDLLAATSYPMTLSEICEQTGIAVASGHRLVKTLLDHQLVALDPSRKRAYCIGSRIFQIASTIYNKQSLIPYFHPIAEILKNEIHKPIFLCVPIGNRVVVVSKVEHSASSAFNIHIGLTMPLHQSASGKAILSMRSESFQQDYFKNEQSSHPDSKPLLERSQEDIVRAKRLGYAVTQGEIDSHVSCIAAPILNLRNEPVAAISAAINGELLNRQSARDYSKYLVQSVRQLSSRIV